MKRVLITGSNRGLGLEWARQYAQANWQVIATCRHPAEAHSLQELASSNANVTVYKLDVTVPPDIEALARILRSEPLDLLINNAGVYFEKFNADHLDALHYGDWEETFRVNVLGAVRMTEAFHHHLTHGQSPLVVAITSHMGSISEISSPGSYAYRSSKAALNAAMKGLSLELHSDGIGVLLLHPGWVQTRMGGPGAPYTVTQSVHAMRQRIEQFTLAQSGAFYRFDGSVIPW
jgi:NAD(P)-dependent dehydrogenase (short-subunit alcohol dehydrogenase family)